MCIYILKLPFVSLFALIWALVECSRGEQGLELIDDEVHVDFHVIGTTSEPVLALISNYSTYTSLFPGFNCSDDELADILGRHLKRYNEDREPQQFCFSYKPHFATIFRDIFITLQYPERVKAEKIRRQVQQAEARAMWVQRWLDAGGNANAIVRAVPHRRYNRFPGVSLLMLAAMFGEWRIVRLLLERGADVNYRDRRTHFTALTASCHAYGSRFTQHLLERAGAIADADDAVLLADWPKIGGFIELVLHIAKLPEQTDQIAS